MFSLLLASFTAAAPSPVDALYPKLDALYRQLHQHPELSRQEKETSALLADRLRGLGFQVTSNLGGHGLVGVLKNGTGHTLLIRTEMDALPVEEKTGLAFASKVTALDDGQKVAVMHACGHDVHMTAWLGAATVLAAEKSRWSGTLVFLAQPAEERGEGAAAMIKDGLWEKIPKPDFAVALHNYANMPSGAVGVVPGFALAAVDSIEVTLYGKGGHGAYPQTTVDPVVMAAKAVLSLQILVSRENNPLDPVVLTVGAIHGGTRPNIIPDQVKLSLSVRSYRPEVRLKLRTGIKRVLEAEASAAGAPKAPEIKIEEGPGAVFNDVALNQQLRHLLEAKLGAANVKETERVMGSEDFGEFGEAGKFPSVMVWLGTVEPKHWAELKERGELPPSLHSPLFAPDQERTLKTGVEALVAMAEGVLPR